MCMVVIHRRRDEENKGIGDWRREGGGSVEDIYWAHLQLGQARAGGGEAARRAHLILQLAAAAKKMCVVHPPTQTHSPCAEIVCVCVCV